MAQTTNRQVLLSDTSSEPEKLFHSCAKGWMMSGVEIDMQIDQMAHNKHDGDNEIHT